MTALDFQALAPHLTLTGGTLVVLLAVSFWRSRRTTLALTLLSLTAAFIALWPGLDAGPRAVTPLLMLDAYAAFFNGLFILIGAVTALLVHRYLQGRAGSQEEFHVLLLVATLGAMTLASAQHFAALLLGLEILSISLYAMVAYPEEDNPPLEAALKYLVLSGVGSTVMLFGMALIYHATGALGFAELAAFVATGDRADLWLTAGQVLFIIGIAFKLSLIPFHMWTPDVYQGAPAPVTGYLATVSKAAAFAVLLRFAVDARLLDLSGAGAVPVATLFAVIAVLSMVVGNVLALLQDSVKRLLAYSSIAHVGYLMIALLVLGVLPNEAMAVETALMFLAGYLAMTLAAFAVVSELSAAAVGERDRIAEYRGLFWRHPLLASVLTAALLSLAGIPLTAGFIAKFYLFAAGVEGALWGLLWAMIVGSAISIYYYLKIVFAMTVRGADAPAIPASFAGLATATVLGVVVLALGIYPTPLIELASDIAQGLRLTP
ncbi:MAG: NADH-quinone oxidoreductase subunit N [Gammaproteobacteria bacterium]|nr:NADH-quinone oxidoreductase subunit N [Gammaproteobacteria bacterium]